jgi:hypothetical protein
VIKIDFINRYWNYYLLIEEEFLNTQKFVEIDELNFDAFSNTYMRFLLTIGSEVDVVMNMFRKQLIGNSTNGNIGECATTITEQYNNFYQQNIIVKNSNIRLIPWDNWTSSTSPFWWRIYNKVKHERTNIDPISGTYYYKLANQKHVVYSLSALFQLLMYSLKRIAEDEGLTHNADKVPQPQSKLFKVVEWIDDTFIDVGNGVIYDIISST